MNALKKKLADGRTVTMVHLAINSPALVELLAELGFDAVMLDCEHTSASVERVEELSRAARASGIATIVRPEKLDAAIVTRYLDCKVNGVIMPHIDNPNLAREFVEILRYARPRDYQNILTVAMIESAEAIASIDDILAVDGIDAFFLARVDLSKSLGLGGDKNHPQVRALVDAMIGKIRRAGRCAGAAGDFGGVADVIDRGAQLIFVTAKSIIEHGARAYQGQLAGAGSASQ